MFKRGKVKYSELQTASVLDSDGDYVSGKGIPDDEYSGSKLATAVTGSSLDLESTFPKGEVQDPAFRDKWFGVAFLAHLGIMIAVATLYATGIWKTGVYSVDFDVTNNATMATSGYVTSLVAPSTVVDDEYDRQKNRMRIVLVTSLVTPLLLGLLAMHLMKHQGTVLIQCSLIFAIAVNVVLGISLKIWYFIFAAILVRYTSVVWHQIPFAAGNHKVAVACVQSNLGMVLFGLASIPLYLAWFALWGYVFVCVIDGMVIAKNLKIAALALSFYWTWHVLRNVSHTTLVGTVGTWWFLPQEASNCCSRALTDSWCRSLTYSFGSICFGSLIVALIEVEDFWAKLTPIERSTRRGGVLQCNAQCWLAWIQALAECFNKWAFVYVGLYGYSFMEAGKNVITLFRHRGWSAIISGSLVKHLLAVMCLCIGLANALVALVLSIGMPALQVIISAWVAFFLGIFMSSFTFGVLVSAVDTIIVLFAEAPAEFKENHPALFQELEDTWLQAWPDVFSADSVRVTPVV